jgi:hypothetical protein
MTKNRWHTSCGRRGIDRLVIAGGRTPSGSNQCASCGCLQISGDVRAGNGAVRRLNPRRVAQVAALAAQAGLTPFEARTWTAVGRSQFHEARTRAGAAVLAWREDREQLGRLNTVVHEGPQGSFGPGTRQVCAGGDRHASASWAAALDGRAAEGPLRRRQGRGGLRRPASGRGLISTRSRPSCSPSLARPCSQPNVRVAAIQSMKSPPQAPPRKHKCC